MDDNNTNDSRFIINMLNSLKKLVLLLIDIMI